MTMQTCQPLSFFFALRTLLCAALFISTGCSTRLQITEYPTTFENQLATFTTYCWAENTGKQGALEKLEPTSGHHRVFDKGIRETINKQLGEKGYQMTDCSQAGFIIDYRMGLHEDIAVVDATTNSNSASNYSNNYGPRWSIGDDQSINYEGLKAPKENVITVRHGTLHVAAFSKDDTVLWHSSAEKTLTDQESDDARKIHIHEAVQRIMDSFPPRK